MVYARPDFMPPRVGISALFDDNRAVVTRKPGRLESHREPSTDSAPPGTSRAQVCTAMMPIRVPSSTGSFARARVTRRVIHAWRRRGQRHDLPIDARMQDKRRVSFLRGNPLLTIETKTQAN